LPETLPETSRGCSKYVHDDLGGTWAIFVAKISAWFFDPKNKGWSRSVASEDEDWTADQPVIPGPRSYFKQEFAGPFYFSMGN
jgi:hypothetical protein